jgi:uncharacterized membrane protein HdeD (DUF308 family)
MLMTPFASRVARAQLAPALRSSWWLLLLTGIVSIVAGVVVLSIDWTISGLAVFIGALLIYRGVFDLLTPPMLDSGSRTWNFVAGLAAIAAGIAIIVWPGPGLLTVAIFIGAALVVWGVFGIVGSIVNRGLPGWWIVLLIGAVELLLGLWALRRPGISLAILITVIGLWTILSGALLTVLAFEARKLGEELERGEPPVAAPPPPATA